VHPSGDHTSRRADEAEVGPDALGPVEPAPTSATEADPHGARVASLFGRDLLYVLVLSAQMLSAIVVSPVLAYLLPPAEFGQMASAIALHQILAILSTLGLGQVMALVREDAGSDTPARSLIAVGVLAAFALTGVAWLSHALWSSQLGFPEDARVVLITIAWTPAAATLGLASVLLLIQDRLKAFALVNVLAGIGGQVGGLATLFLTGSRTASAYATGGLVTLTLAALAGVVLAKPRWRGVADVSDTWRALRLGVPLMIGSLAVLVLTAADRLVIQRLMGPAEAGRYQIAYVVGNVAVLLLGMIDTAWIPRITAVREQAQRWRLIAVARDGLLGLMIPTIVGITLASPLVLHLVAPAEYRTASLLLVVYLVALASFPVIIGTASGWALTTLKKTGSLAIATVAAAVLNVGLNLVLVPIWGLSGAAVATIVAFMLQAALQQLYVPRRGRWARTPIRIVAGCLAAAALSAATMLLPQTPAWNVARFLVALGCLPWFLRRLKAARGDGGS
jgi:O-antigen/teichoic acid export membrane protein